jgi:hypothetical protein
MPGERNTCRLLVLGLREVPKRGIHKGLDTNQHIVYAHISIFWYYDAAGKT